MDTDVLVVGAGPTGLMLANQLGRRGIRTLIIDRHDQPAQQTRAMAVHARTLEIYAHLGIAESAISRGRRGNAANVWADGQWRARIPLGDIGKSMSPFPFVLMLGQDENELILGAKLGDWGIATQWNTELVAIDQHPDRVEATLRQPDGRLRRITTAWVAGCDGARSTLRDLCGIGFPGAPYEHVFFVADTEAKGPMRPEELNAYLWKDGFHLFFPMRGVDRWRVIGILPPHLRDRDTLRFDEVVPYVQREAGAALAFKACDWFSTYRIHHRAAAQFRDRRCFLLGDAAHVHSPMGGQGMNTGLQDAYNLSWKLALVIDGSADATLLDSYDLERKAVARRLLDTTDRAFRLVVSNHRFAGLFRTRIFSRVASIAMHFEAARRLAFRTISQVGIQYRASPLSRNVGALRPPSPMAGDRFPWLKLRLNNRPLVEDVFQSIDDTRFTLLLIGQASEDISTIGSGRRLKTITIAMDAGNAASLADAGIVSPAFFLIRPDGYIGLAGGRLEPGIIDRYLADCRIRLTEDIGSQGARAAS